ncbi:hypothetical protein B0H16DRAFT_1894453 [Mycena metata]|uniref:F-box domain-containing protein n=1 Tax=Mycena metata TaxID=1033252 RepID=A0AAD7HSG5_9AGAR|nr:hypothetical protein B0H16DRAFT_1894453 [Mycena metata]
MSTIRAALAEQTAKTKGRSDADIRKLAAESELRLASLESKIAELIEQRERERITAVILRHLVAPIRSLPVELLAEIFLLTIHHKESDFLGTLGDEESDFLNKPWHFRDAYRVSHVCSEWLQITLSTPQLWTGHVRVVHRDTGADADGLRAWLARSEPLHVPVVLTGVWDVEAVRLPPVLEELLRVAPRWGFLCIDSFLPPLLYQRLADCTLDSLEEVVLRTIDTDGLMTAPHLSFLGNSPRLRKLNVFADPSLALPWAQLTELTLAYGDSASVSLNIVAQYTNLATLTLDGDDVLDDTGTQVTLPSLRVLNCTFHSGREAQLSSLNFLSAPMLETCRISLEFRGNSRSWAGAAFMAFLRSPNVTHLRLASCPLTSHDLIAALAHAPSLTHLWLQSCERLDDTFLLALHSHADTTTPPLVPLLHDFRLQDMSELLTEPPVVGMLASRWRAGSATARWSRVVLSHDHRHATKDFWDAIEELQRQGLPVEIPEIPHAHYRLLDSFEVESIIQKMKAMETLISQ